jgi:hypothetical protein
LIPADVCLSLKTNTMDLASNQPLRSDQKRPRFSGPFFLWRRANGPRTYVVRVAHEVVEIYSCWQRAQNTPFWKRMLRQGNLKALQRPCVATKSSNTTGSKLKLSYQFLNYFTIDH